MSLPPLDPQTIIVGTWLWESYGKDFFAWVTKRGSKAVGDQFAQQWEKFDWRPASQRYRIEMSRLYGTMQILGMANPVPLSDIFTDVYILDKPNAWRRHAFEQLNNTLLPEGDVPNKANRRDALGIVAEKDRIFILGKPGAGKTTLLKHLVHQSLDGNIRKLPIFISLKDWADSRLNLMEYIVRQFSICSFPDANDFIEYVLSNGKAIVLFDGLDEVNEEDGLRNTKIHEIKNLVRQYASISCVITCRTASVEYQFDGFSYCELADFTAVQVNTFVSNWFNSSETKKRKFLQEFAKPENQPLRDLSKTPLLLTLLCISFDETMTFPPRRVEIYEDALQALMRKWDTSRSIKRDEVYRLLSLGRKEQLLARIAVKAFQNNAIFMKKKDLEQEIVSFIETLPSSDVADEVDGEVILKSIESQHGIIVERFTGIHSFSHLTFQEYFTAKYVVAHLSNKQVISNTAYQIHNVRWREVLSLTCSLLDIENGDIFFDRLYRRIQDIAIESISLPNLIDECRGYIVVNSARNNASIGSIICYLYLSHDIFLLLASAVETSIDENTIDVISNLRSRYESTSEAAENIVSHSESSLYSLMLELDHLKDYTNVSELLWRVIVAIDKTVVDNYPIKELEDIKLQVNEVLDNILPIVRSISNILDETYIRATTEFIGSDSTTDVDELAYSRIIEETDLILNKDEVYALALSDVLSQAEYRVNQLNNAITNLVFNATKTISTFILNNHFKIEYKGSISIDVSIRAAFTHHIIYILSTFARLADENTLDIIRQIAQHVVEDIKDCVIDNISLDDNSIFLNSGERQLHNDLQEIINVLLVISGFNLEVQYSVRDLEEYLQAVLTLNECLEVASISNRDKAYENMFTYTLPF